MVLSLGPYGDPISAPSYVPIVDPSIYPNEQQVRAIQEESWTTLEQVKALENIIALGEIKVDKSDQF